MNRNAVVDDVQIALLKVDDAFSSGIFDVSISDVPFFRNGPIEDLCPRWNFKNPQRNAFANQPQSFANPAAGDASADGIESTREIVQFPASIHGFLND